MTHVNRFSISGYIYSDLDLKSTKKTDYTTSVLDFQLRSIFRVPNLSRWVIDNLYVTCRATGTCARHIAKYCGRGDLILCSGYLRMYPVQSVRPLAILRVTEVDLLKTIGVPAGTIDEIRDQTIEAEKRLMMVDAADDSSLTPEEINDLLDTDQRRLDAAKARSDLASKAKNG